MGFCDLEQFFIESDSLILKSRIVPWDSEVFDANVAQIEECRVLGASVSRNQLSSFNDWMKDNAIVMASCRLTHEQLKEAYLLEMNDFRFIEMVLHPTITNLQNYKVFEHGLSIEEVTNDNVLALSEVAASVFKFERFHVDPFVDDEVGNQRYKNWVENISSYKNQQLYKILLRDNVVAFFITEQTDDEVYWHLTAVDKKWQGRGIGLKTWMAMIEYHKVQGITKVLTTISARNTPVLNLYSKLQFQFLPPEMTFHWTKNDFSTF